MHDLLENLNPQQREAVTTTEGPLLILAGAGSGKTRAITCRIAYLMNQLAVGPESILAVTFTNKAADQMKQRVAKLIGHDMAAQPHVSTFHSFCVRVLRREIDGLGISRNFSRRARIPVLQRLGSRLQVPGYSLALFSQVCATFWKI